MSAPVAAAPSVATPAVTHAAVDTADLAEKISIRGLNFYYGAQCALQDISVRIHPNVVTAFIGLVMNLYTAVFIFPIVLSRRVGAGQPPRAAAP